VCVCCGAKQCSKQCALLFLRICFWQSKLRSKQDKPRYTQDVQRTRRTQFKLAKLAYTKLAKLGTKPYKPAVAAA
jgi:hypothetical protein